MVNISDQKKDRKMERLQKQQKSQARITGWWESIQNFHRAEQYRIEMNPGSSERLFDLSEYENFIVQNCMSRFLHGAERNGLNRLDDFYEDILGYLFPMLSFLVYNAEIEHHAWGVANTHQINYFHPKQEKFKLRRTPLPNFLLPTDCLYCGQPLGFQSYQDTTIRITKHSVCRGKWDKGIRLAHHQAMDAYYNMRDSPNWVEELPLLRKHMENSYAELAHLYKLPYKPRYTLLEAYADIPNEAWVKPLAGIGSRNELLKMPFIQPALHDYDLIIAVDEEKEWVEDYRQAPTRPAISLSELDQYFIDTV